MLTVEKEWKKRAQEFRQLHVAGKPLILFNVWDAGSAAAVTAAGALAIGTSSWSVASASGFLDGERTPLVFAIENLRRVVNATQRPVTVDLESGYGNVEESVGLAIRAGAIGCNLEDSEPDGGLMRDIVVQVDRLQRARSAADREGLEFFINARTDVFLERRAEQSDDVVLREAVQRTAAYAEAGADGIFVPGVTDIALIERIGQLSPIPVNVMISEGSPTLSALAESGVSRVSFGPKPYLMAMAALERAAREILTASGSNIA